MSRTASPTRFEIPILFDRVTRCEYEVTGAIPVVLVDTVRGSSSTGTCCQVSSRLIWYQAPPLLPPLTVSTKNARIIPRTFYLSPVTN